MFGLVSGHRVARGNKIIFRKVNEVDGSKAGLGMYTIKIIKGILRVEPSIHIFYIIFS